MSGPIRAGFIGLGAMGGPIARRLARCGFTVTGCDVSPATLEAFDEPGTRREADPLATAATSDMLGICVRTDAQLEDLCGDGRLFAAMGAGKLVILHSTVAPELAVRMAELARRHGTGLVDVGVSGGGPAASEGKLSLFVGAEPADFERAAPWLNAIGRQVSHLGPVGRGQVGKLLNNLVSIANYGMSAAICDMASALGFEREPFLAALEGGSAQSFALRVGPGFVTPRPGRETAEAFMDLHDLLQKDVEHCRALPAGDAAAKAALLASCEAMLTRLRRAAREASGESTTPAGDIVNSYFAAVRAKDLDAFVSLFSEDGSFTMPNGTRLQGRPAIRESQARVFSAGSPQPTPVARYAGPEGVAVEVEARLPDGTLRHTVNVYRFSEDGLIRDLRVTMRPGA